MQSLVLFLFEKTSTARVATGAQQTSGGRHLC